MSRIRVLEIISGFAVEGPLGGIERFGIELAQALDADLIEPIVCGMWAYGTPYEQEWVRFLTEKGIAAFMAAPWEEHKPTASFWHAYQGCKQQLQPSIDIIHSHCQFGDVLALLLKRRLGAKVLVRTVHNEREWGKRPLRRLLLTHFLYPWQFDQEIGVAQQVVDNLNGRPLAQWAHQPAVKGYNALNLARFTHTQVNRQEKRRSLGIPTEAKVVGTIGRLSEQKGYAVLLDAAAQLLHTIPDLYFLIVGTGDLAEILSQQSRHLGIDKQVLFTGARKDVAELLSIMDVFVSSSLWEGIPTVVMESMAARVPVIATRVAGNLELIQEGINGLLVPPNDAPQLAEAITKMFALSTSEREQMTARARIFVEERFSITAVARQHNHLYQQLIIDAKSQTVY